MRLGSTETLDGAQNQPIVAKRSYTENPHHSERLAHNSADGSRSHVNWQLRLKRRWSQLDDLLFSLQPERLIALARLTFSTFALFAIVLDPTRPARNLGETYAVLIAYVAYAWLLAAAPSRGARNARRHYITHGIDIIVLSALCALSGELASPFWAFVGFTLISSAIRWGFGGALATALLLVALFTAIGWPYYDPTRSDLNGLIMRSAYALVAAVMLGYFASYRDRSRQQLAQLAAWPIEATVNDSEPTLEASLQHASKVLGGLKLLVIWNDSDEPTGRMAYCNGQACTLLDFDTETWPPLDNPGPARFHAGGMDTIGLPESITRRLFDGVRRGRRNTVCCSAPFATPRYHGQVFVIDPVHATDDMLSLTEIVAGRIAFELEQFALMRELASAAGWRERGRMARDLHDSVLQDLTAASLQLKIASGQSPDSMPASLGLIGDMLQEQQRRIRRFVDDAHPKSSDEPQLLKERLEAFSGALSAQWSCIITIDVRPPGIMAPNSIIAALCQIVSEATANAARHGQADRMDVVIKAAAPGLDIAISDNGRGLAELNPAGSAGPQSIRARVADLSGQFQLLPSRRGLMMRIFLPL